MGRPKTDRSRYSPVIIGMGAAVEPAVLVARFLVDFRAVFFFFGLAFEVRFFGDFLAAFFPAFFFVDFLAVFLAAFFFFAISSGSFRYSARVTSVGLSPRALTVGERHQEYDCVSKSAVRAVGSARWPCIHARI
jgi:hypothetical protein